MYLSIRLLSDTTFGRGDGVAGLIDNEVEHDPTSGLPIIKGRTLKGLLVEACADVLFSLSLCAPQAHTYFEEIAAKVFGVPGSDHQSSGLLHVHNATLPLDFVQRVQHEKISGEQVFEALTHIRRQTAVDARTDTPKNETLRGTRTVIRDVIFHAALSSTGELNADDYALLAACAANVRHAGLNRTRGMGHVALHLMGTADGRTHDEHLAHFSAYLQGGA